MFFYNRELFRVAKEDVRSMVLCCAVMFIYSASYFFSLVFINLSLAFIILNLHPSLVAVASVFLYREKITPKLITVLTITFLGLAMTMNLFTRGIGALSVPGLILAFTATISAAANCICLKKVSAKYHTFTINFYGMMTTVIGYSAMLPLFRLEPLGHQQLITALVAAIPYISGYIFYSAGVKYSKPSFASIFSNTETVFIVLLTTLILGEAFSVSQGIGIVLIVGALIFLETELPKRKKLY